ncbi:hypothetical protein OPQ81_000357 [Rhizoctonia solani]|nr:hypothetical protein OPQ81_000357 [Rhizoctonia solani]
MRFGISSFIALTLATGAIAAQPAARYLSINPPILSPRKHEPGVIHPASNVNHLSSSSMELERREDCDDDHDSDHGPGSDPQTYAKPSSCAQIQKRCNIRVTHASNGTVLGFVSPVWNRHGEYGIIQTNQNGSLEVSFSFSPKSPTQLDLLATNHVNKTYPYMGATVGFVSPSNDLVVGGYNYLFITGTTKIPAGPPVGADNNSFGGTTGIPKSAESAIWTYNRATKDLTPQWVNTNGSIPTSYVVYANDFNNAFVMVGDLGVFGKTFGKTYPLIKFTCVAPDSAYESE